MNFYFSTDWKNHLTGARHSECPARLNWIETALRERGLWEKLDHRTASPASDNDLLWCHTPAHLARIAALTQSGGGLADGGDTVVSSESEQVAREVVGAACAAVDEVMKGETTRAFVAGRPPGHHAERDRIMGFCLFNAVAVAARRAQLQHGVKRVAILDWDVHHGNGTQDIFYKDNSVLFVSLHGSPLWPYSGLADETGSGAGRGFTRNFPLENGSGRAEYEAAWREVETEVREFKPELILVSAGFDAHARDPLGGMTLQSEDFGWLATEVRRWADELCDGRVVGITEGGYDRAGLGESVAATLEAWL